MKLEVEKKWKEEKYPKSSLYHYEPNEQAPKKMGSGIPTQINCLHAHQNIPNKGFSSLSTIITTHIF